MPLPTPSLAEATRCARAAAHAGDLNSLARALADREAALLNSTSAEQATALLHGDDIARLLTEIKRTIVAEHSHLQQLREGFASARAASSIEFQG